MAIANIPVIGGLYLGRRILRARLDIKALLRAEFDDLEDT
jgi:hypothetical protein